VNIDQGQRTIPWGRNDSLPLEIPETWPAPAVFEPDLSGALDDYPSALREALNRPERGMSVDGTLSSASKVAIVVDDPSRWTPVREALPIVLERIHRAGVARENVTISVGVGRHLAVTPEVMRERVGPEAAESYRCFSPPVDDLSEYVHLGETPQGVPVHVFRPVAEANVRVLIGSVLPHLQAGFGGGYKLIFPGCSHRSTLGALHRQGLGGDAGLLLGSDPRSNPMRAAIRDAAALLPGVCISISHLLGEPGQIFHVATGDPDAVQDILSAEVKRRFQAPAGPLADIIVAGNDPWPGDPMQSFKVLINHRAAGKPGGVLVGFFWTDLEEIDRSFPMAPMRAIAASGSVGGWAARHGLAMADRVVAALKLPSSFMVRWARELVVDRAVLVYSPLLHDRIGPRLGPIRIFAEQAPLWKAAGDAAKSSAPTCRVFPRGGLTYAPKRNGA
jgi:hypothetical protein